VVVAWIMGINMDLDFNILETGSLALAIIATAFTLQVRILIERIGTLRDPSLSANSEYTRQDYYIS
jgi:hypothetical protein